MRGALRWLIVHTGSLTSKNLFLPLQGPVQLQVLRVEFFFGSVEFFGS